MAVLGIDGCRRGWIGIVLNDDRPLTAVYGRTLPELQSRVEIEIEVVAIDIPIGLPEFHPREADLLARDFVGPRRSSVFIVPPRRVLVAEPYATANEIALELGVPRVAPFMYALREKIFEVERWVEQTGWPIREVHPEVCFRAMKKSVLHTKKKSWAGFHERVQLLRQQGLSVDVDLGLAGTKAAVDDVLDAVAAAWSARNIAQGDSLRLPEGDSQDDRKAPAIWV